MQIVSAQTPEHVDRTRALFAEYWDSFGFTPCFQGFDEEIAGLPGKYAGPRGKLALAVDGDDTAGCVAIRPIDDERCELKRLYVRPAYRGKGVGRALLMWALAEALACGYKEMLADTVPVMSRAIGMYDRVGFQRIGPYAGEPAPDAIYLKLTL